MLALEPKVDLLEIYDAGHSELDERLIAIGPIRRGLVLVVVTERSEDTIRIVSAHQRAHPPKLGAGSKDARGACTRAAPHRGPPSERGPRERAKRRIGRLARRGRDQRDPVPVAGREHPRVPDAAEASRIPRDRRSVVVAQAASVIETGKVPRGHRRALERELRAVRGGLHANPRRLRPGAANVPPEHDSDASLRDLAKRTPRRTT